MARVLSLRFDTFGDVTTASSRLRAWRLGEFLRQSGHRVTMNEGERPDVYVCQKIRPFDTLRAMREAGALVVYDFDDHLLLEGVESHGIKDEVVACINSADAVTVGSDYLAEAARSFHDNVFVLENPVDIDSAAPGRERSAALERIGWFGTAAGLVDLRSIETAERVETVTRGGDIEFDLNSIDRTLAGFDLLLLPVELNRWNLAKNANRMIKAVALGVPVLATATPAHVATGSLLGLDDRFLVRDGESFDAKIAALRRDFGAAQDAIAKARGRALEAFSMQRIGGDWLAWIQRLLDARGKASPRPAKTVPLGDVALVTIRYAPGAPEATREADDGIAFGSRRDVAPSETQDYLAMFEALWDAVAAVEQEWVLFQPQGFRPARGLAGELRRCLESAPHRHVFILRSQERGFAADEWAAYDMDLRGTLCRPRDPGMVLARRSWLMQQPWRPARCVSYWTWVLVVEALSQRVAEVVATPVVLRDQVPAIANVCAEYAGWAKRDGKRQAELPYPDAQWRSLSADILAAVAERLPAPASAAFAVLASDPEAGSVDAGKSLDALGRVEQELLKVYASASWRLTSPLRAAAKLARRIGVRGRVLGE